MLDTLEEMLEYGDQYFIEKLNFYFRMNEYCDCA